MSYINKYLRNFKPYKVASHKIWTVDQETRSHILKLDWNEATIQPTPLVKENINKLLNENEFFNFYPATNNEELLKKLSNYVDLPICNIQYFGSSDSLHEYIAKLYISVGDPVLIIGPTYDNFRLTAEVNGASVFFCETDEQFNFDKEKFEMMIENISPSLIYVCNPNNPTGLLHKKEYIEYLISKYSESVFLVDEAYFEFSNVTVSNLVTKHENLLVSRTMSKAFALANFRIGYLLASKRNIEYISSIRNPKNITTFAQVAAISALSDLDYMRNYVKEVCFAKEFFCSELSKLNIYFKTYPSAGNFVLVNCFSVERKNRILAFLEKNNVFIRNVNQSPLLKTCVRVSIGTKSQMRTVINLFNEFIKNENDKKNSNL